MVGDSIQGRYQKFIDIKNGDVNRPFLIRKDNYEILLHKR